MSKNNLGIYVILMTHDDSLRAINVIKQLNKQTFRNFRILLVDDNSSSEELTLLKEIKDENVDLFSLPAPFKFGFDFKWNLALKKAFTLDPKYIYYIHTDMRINNSNLLEVLYDAMESDPKLGGVGPTIYNGEGVKTWGKDIVKIRMGKKYVLNETFLIRTVCYKKMGLIPEKLVYYGNEYFTFNWLSDNGYSVKCIDNVSVVHFGGGVSLSFQNYKDYYRPRTTILIMKLFHKQEGILNKLKYFKDELHEPITKLKLNIKKLEFVKFSKTVFFLIIGTIAGLVISIKPNPPLN